MEKPRKKLVLRKLSVTRLTDDAVAAVIGGPPSRTDCAPPVTATCTQYCNLTFL